MAASFHAALRLIFFLLNLTGHWEEALRVAGREHHPAALYGVSMKGADGDVVHLAVHKQDYSFAGFANRSGHWHVFRGDEAVLPNARRLPFRKTYRDLIGGIENVPDLTLGKAASLRAIWALSSYDADVGGGREVVKRGVATLSVVIAQAARLKPILETVDGGWESGEARMAVEHLPYIEHWDTMSFEGLRWEENYVRPPSFTIRKDPASRLPRVQLSARILKHPFSTSSSSAQNFPFSPLHSPPFPSLLFSLAGTPSPAQTHAPPQHPPAPRMEPHIRRENTFPRLLFLLFPVVASRDYVPSKGAW